MFKILPIFPFVFFLWPMGYIKMCNLISNYLGFFGDLSVIDFHVIPLWSENTLCMTWILLNLLGFFNGSECGLSECIVMPLSRVVHIFIRSSWLIVLFKSSIFLLIFCLLVVSITERDIEIYDYNSGFVYFFLLFYQFFASCIL